MKLLLAGIALALVVYFLPDRYQHEYYYSADKKQCVTRIDFLPYDWVPNHTYFIYGHFDDNSIADYYAHPERDKTIGGNWSGYVHFEEGHANFLLTRGKLISKLEDSFKAIDLQKAGNMGYSSDSLLNALKNDRSGNTYYVEGTNP